MNDYTHRDTLAVGSTTPTEAEPTPDSDHSAAAVEKRRHQERWPEPARVARDRLREVTKEAFPRSEQYRLLEDETPSVGSCES